MDKTDPAAPRPPEAGPRRGLLQRLIGRDARAFGPKLRALLTLRPYGERLLTPAAQVWLLSAWIVILLMATIEGFVWGAVGASLVPDAAPWLAPPVAVFMFALMFSVIWIVDSSLIMSERPTLRLRAGAGRTGLGPTLRWLLGLVVRVGIVAISLYVTAPFIEKLIRADDIAGWHQRQVEAYFAERAETLREQVRARVEQLGSGFQGRIDALEAQIAQAEATLASARERRDRLEAEYAPEVDVLRRDLAEARQRVGDEVLGRDGRPEGYGPEARKWDARAERLAGVLDAKQTELDARLAPIQSTIDEQQARLAELSERLGQVRSEQQALVERVTAQVAAEQPPPEPPKLTFAAQSKGLTALRESPAEAGVPHFETVEGFAQAALGILFFALIALKLFEPEAVHAYFSEAVQERYRQYLAGGLAHIPGFSGHDKPARRLTPVELMSLWERWQRDPQGFVDRRKDVFTAESRVRRLSADRDYEIELLQRRRGGIDHELALERRRREAELRAREQEIDARLAQFKERLSDATRLERERDAQSLTADRRQQAEAAADSARARRDRRLADLQQALEQAREELASHRARADERQRARAANAEALAEARGRAEALDAQVDLQRKEIRDLVRMLPPGTAASGPSLPGWLARLADSSPDGSIRRSRRHARQTLQRLQRETAATSRERDEQRGRVAVLELEQQQLDAVLADLGAELDAAGRRCEHLRQRIDRLLLQPLETWEPPLLADQTAPAAPAEETDAATADPGGQAPATQRITSA